MTLFQRLEQLAQRYANKPAIVHAGSTTSYQQLYRQSLAFIDYLTKQIDIKAGVRVAILSENHPNYFAMLFAASGTGVIVVPLNWRLSLDELQHAVDDATPSVLFHSDQYAEYAITLAQSQSIKHALSWQTFADNKPELGNLPGVPSTQSALSSPLLLVYTSGTTGRPKGAVISQTSMLSSARMSRDAFSLNAQDAILCSLPLFHVGGLNIQALPGLLDGATLYLQSMFDPTDAINIIRQHNISQYLVVPTVLAALLAHNDWPKAVADSLRCLGIGSMDVPIQQINQMHALGVPVVQIYGATETGPVAIHQSINNATRSAGSIGIAGSECQVRLLDNQHDDVALDTPGEIALKGENIFSYYWNNPQATQDAMIDGWFKTGDVARQDADGYYWFTDRLKNVIISGGENIYAAEVERVLASATGIAEVAVVGIPDSIWGESVVAVIVVNDNSPISKDALQLHCQPLLARFKHPQQYYRLDKLPRNALGKVQYDKLKNIVMAQPDRVLK